MVEPKYWNLVHRDDQKMGRAPRSAVTFFVEGMLFGLAAMYVLAFLLGLFLHGNNWHYVLIDVVVIPMTLIILGLVARRRRVKINNQIENFYGRRSGN